MAGRPVTAVGNRLAVVRQQIAAAAAASGRTADDVTLVAVSKTASAEDVVAALEAGQRVFGESRAQELGAKAAAVGRLTAGSAFTPVWHFVGPLQTNKVRLVRPVVSLLHSLDRVKLAAAWLKGPGPPPPVLLEVNISLDPDKHGVSPADADSILETIHRLGIDVRGLMTIPRRSTDPNRTRQWFAELRELGDRLRGQWPNLTELSMGMTEDFELAIEEGATYVRVGRAIFGSAAGT